VALSGTHWQSVAPVESRQEPQHGK
jgi:hypothetical protein